ncbi:hypothetical protein ACFV3R_12710 [Streptomyces sp. NPDC059740]|uniref:hypothetical protein n=1 Tax=Streptomyces sp. NPDC059740 TaxID=3346926 RepID=UPI00364C15D1
MDELSPAPAWLLTAMTGGGTVDALPAAREAACAALTPAEHGALLPVALRTLTGAPRTDRDLVVWYTAPARLVARQVTDIPTQPWFDAASLAELFTALAERGDPKGLWWAAAALARSEERAPQAVAPPGLVRDAGVLVRAALATGAEHLAPAFAVAAVAGGGAEAELVGRLRDRRPTAQGWEEALALLLALGPAERAVLAEQRRAAFRHTPWPPLRAPGPQPGRWSHPRLARALLTAAAERLRALHAGEVPYVSDRALTAEEVVWVGWAVRCALRDGQPWAGELLASVLPRLVVAPTRARTAPSQSGAVALAQAVEAHPGPEAVAALREAVDVVRHAGLAKKLAGTLRRAERALGHKPARRTAATPT